ncbi:hypothetical protein [Lentzea sp. NEAU-D7]|uniref:hypothetical protein n=1 Tax=Lentzea sp. NEAU-D7 TaxID=2994667 RepID=UPI00224AECAC|nr:hypothetical protein [Lentzea sp. NEAU-D7]MCX2949423.1 hypothetical protein [Lentzea sp. NEAU-D7]
MFQRQFAWPAVLALVAVFGLASPGAAVASPVPAPAAYAVQPSGDFSAAASPVCSATKSYGVIRYQACFRYNCDSDSCFRVSYIGLINTAASARTVRYRIFGSSDPNGDDSFLEVDDSITLAAGQQRTINSPGRWETPCAWWASAWLHVKHGSSDWSAAAQAKGFMYCV